MTILHIAEIIGSLTAIGGAAVTVWKFTKKLTAVGDGLRSLLRSDIMAIYYRHCDEEEPTLREYERKNLDSLYESYSVQGGNSFVSDLYNNEMRHWRVVR